MKRILVVYHLKEPRLRCSVRDHLLCFGRYAPCTCCYLNLLVRRVPSYLRRIRFDLIIFHTTLLSCRWNLAAFDALRAKARPLKDLSGARAVLPQDEFLHTAVLCEFINEFDVRHVFSTAPESEWPKIYPSVDRRRVEISRVLTGYLDDSTVARIERRRRSSGPRTIDIGYRSWRPAPWLGRHGLLKGLISDTILRMGPRFDLSVDSSTDHAFLGDDWFRFLLKCKYTIGVEGGASILDATGEIRRRTESYLATNPDAAFDEIELACFPGLDGSLALTALSPRHLEACATRTCQLLIEGDYNGVLMPELHYLPVKRDFSNLNELLEAVGRDDRREAIVERAYRDIVASGRYSYRTLVDHVMAQCLAQSVAAGPSPHAAVSGWLRLADVISWCLVALRWGLIRALDWMRLLGPVKAMLGRTPSSSRSP